MARIIKNNRGWSMPIVVIIATVLVMLAVALLGNTMQSFHFINSQENIEDAFFAGESSLEKWFNILNNETTGIDFSVLYTGPTDMSIASNVEAYADWLVQKLKDILEEHKTQIIDVRNHSISVKNLSDSDANYARVILEELMNMTDDEGRKYIIDGENLKLMIGLQALSTYSRSNSRYRALNKKVYGQLELSFKLPEDKAFKLLGPVYSFGDFMIDNSNTEVLGDCYVFGSFPEKVLDPKQWHYGGIYALNNAHLTVDGNAYVRSFIRTGKYLQDGSNSRISITKDAIAQCIQLFGVGDRVLVYRNAYTFDDLEINGANSIIAINGSYVGMSTGGDFHDQSSAIVNSAPIHNIYSLESLLSRIVINGDCIVQGGTFKIEEDGKAVGQIEDAALAWDATGDYGNAFYKTYKGDFRGDDYHNKLQHEYNLAGGHIRGFSNLFQVWDPQPRGLVEEWLNNNVMSAIRGESNALPRVPGKLTGFWNYELAANDGIYFNKIETTAEDMKILDKINESFVLDNIYDPLNKANLRYGNNAWDHLRGYDLSNGGEYDDYKKGLEMLIEGDTDSVDEDISGGTIMSSLKDLTHFFAEREYPSTGNPSWLAGAKDEFTETLDKLGRLIPTEAGEEYLIRINDPALSGNYDIDEFYAAKFPGDPDASLYNKRNPELALDNQYYLVVNSNPNICLEVSGEFNGIIFTAGRVDLKEGADIRGAVVAAGKTVSNIPDIGHLKITEDNADELDSGAKASIYSDGSNVKIDFYLGHTPYIDFGAPADSDSVPVTSVDGDNDFLSRAARKRLLKKFNDIGLHLEGIF